MSVEILSEALRFGGIGAAAVGLAWLVVSLVLPERIIEGVPTKRAVLVVAAMITSVIAFTVATIGIGLGG